MAHPNHIKVRLATEEDCPQIWHLLKEQEDNDPESSRLFLSIEKLKKDGFGSKRFFYILVAEDSSSEVSHKASTLVGYLFYNMIYCSWTGKILLIKDLYVDPAFRMQGIAKKLWNFVCKIVLEENFAKIQWNVQKNTEDLRQLSEDSGAVVEDENHYIFHLLKSNIMKME